MSRNRDRQHGDVNANKKAKSNHQYRSKRVQEAFATKNTDSIKKWHERIKINHKLIQAIFFSALFAILHFKHLQNLFENDKHFSHLSELERELSFRSEAGLYYHYFKRLVVDVSKKSNTTKSFVQLISEEFLNDNRTEYPSTINALQRFNLYPELILASLYRLCDRFQLLSKQCWLVTRTDNMPKVESCDGLAEPIYFYTNCVFALNAFFMVFLFLLCWLLNNESILAGLIGCAFYFFNHSEATRVMWVPALRENFSFPFHLSQILALVYFIKSEQTKSVMNRSFLTLFLTTLVYLLPWQFAQFSLATQVASLFASFSLGFLDKHKFLSILKAHFLALTACFLLMFFNRMLISSLYAALLVSAVFLLLMDRCLIHFIEISLPFHIVGWLKKISITLLKSITFLMVTFLFKKCFLDLLIQSEDDSHIWDILKSKFSAEFQTFHTRLYTCAREFDFLDTNTFKELTYTFTLPLASLIFIFYIIKCLNEYLSTRNDNTVTHNGENEAHSRSLLMSLVSYISFQMCAFFFMALLIMRLKLFWTPFLCVFCSFLANSHEDFNIIDALYYFITRKRLNKWSKISIIVALLGCASIGGVNNLVKQYKIIGEYSNYDMELMMNWINDHTRLDDAFAGSMPIMANVKLSTNRPITNHPHYENADLRNRTELIYTRIFGYRPIQELHYLLKNEYQARYLIFETDRCRVNKQQLKCSMTELSHISLEKITEHSACDTLLKGLAWTRDYFQITFMRGALVIFKVV